MQRHTLSGWIGILSASAVWIASVLALAYGMDHSAQVSLLQTVHPTTSPHARASNFDLPMVLGCAAFTLLQLVSFLLFAFVLRAFWRLRSAMCFTLAAGLVIAGNAAGLLALLVWLGITLGAA